MVEQNNKNNKQRYEAVNAPTQFERTIYDNDQGKTIDLFESLAIIMSDIQEIKKIIKG